MQANVTSLLSKFGGMSYERIEMELDWLNGNLTTASTAFSGARYNTSEKLEQFKVVRFSIFLYFNGFYIFLICVGYLIGPFYAGPYWCYFWVSGVIRAKNIKWR